MAVRQSASSNRLQAVSSTKHRSTQLFGRTAHLEGRDFGDKFAADALETLLVSVEADLMALELVE